MKNKINSGFFAVSVIIGFMLAIQFQAVQEPEVRDTRDTWELKADLLTEQKQQEELLEEIKSLEDQLARYQTERSSSKERALKDTLEKLKEEAGLTDVTGQGLVLTINPLPDDLLLNKPVEQILFPIPVQLGQQLVPQVVIQGNGAQDPQNDPQLNGAGPDKRGLLPSGL